MKKVFVCVVISMMGVVWSLASVCYGTGTGLRGMFKCEHAYMDSLEFRDSHHVVIRMLGMAFPTTYQYEEGYVYIQHDKGGSFSFKVVNGSTLLGEDVWDHNGKCLKQ